MTFTKTVFVTEDGTVKQFGELDAQFFSTGGPTGHGGRGAVATRKVWKAYPNVSEREDPAVDGQPGLVTPRRRRISISPRNYDPGTGARTEGTLFTLKKGESKSADGLVQVS